MSPDDQARRTRETAALFEELGRVEVEADRQELLQRIVVLNSAMALALARRYHRRGVDAEDLDQTALLALLVAARAFDPTRGFDFLTFAVPTMVGALKQYFRDQAWTIRVPRRVQEVQLLLDRANLPEADETRYGTATLQVLSERLHVPEREVEAALRARGCFRPSSLDEVGSRADRRVWGDGESEADDRYSAASRADLRVYLSRLDPRERRMLWLRYGEDHTQRVIAREVRLTQPQVSRILTRVVGELRELLEPVEPAGSPGPPARAGGDAPGGSGSGHGCVVGSIGRTGQSGLPHHAPGEGVAHHQLPRHLRSG